MKKILTISAALALSGCASFGIGTISPDAIPKVGKILEKETVINRVVENNPVFYGGFAYGHFGYGHGYRRGGWAYDPFFDSPSFRTTVREDVFYQYRIMLDKTERMTLQSPYNLDIGQCVTVWQVPNSTRSPYVEKNLDCKLPAVKK